MRHAGSRWKTGLLTTASAIVLAVTPLTVDVSNMTLSPAVALAKGGNGGGHGGGSDHGGGGDGPGNSDDGGPGGGPGGSSAGGNAASAGGGGNADHGAADHGSASGNGNGFGHDAGISGSAVASTDEKAGHDNHGSTASQLGALNAAHASPTAREHAAPNSRVGLIAAYADAVQRSDTLNKRADELNAKIADLKASQLSDAEKATLEAELAADLTDQQRTSLEAQLSADLTDQQRAGIEAQLATGDLTDAQRADLQSQLDGDLTDAQRADIEAQLGADLTDEQRAAIEEQLAQSATAQGDLRTAEAELANVQADLETSSQAEANALDAAANKPITEKVVDAVKNLLGIGSTTVGDGSDASSSDIPPATAVDDTSTADSEAVNP